MTLRDQIEVRTNAANTSVVSKHLKWPEKEMLKSLQAWNTDSERLLSAASHVSNEKRKGWLLLVTVMIEICGGYCEDWNDLKRLVNKLQNVMFSKTRTNCMYSNSASQARDASVQSPKREEILRWNTVTHHLLIFIIFFEGVWQCDTCDKHLPKFVMRYIREIFACCCQQKEALRSSCMLPPK